MPPLQAATCYASALPLTLRGSAPPLLPPAPSVLPLKAALLPFLIENGNLKS